MPSFRRRSSFEEPKTPFYVHLIGFSIGLVWTAAIFWFCFGVLQPKTTEAIKGYSLYVQGE